nr:MAG TPA: hypothetical protein [Microviridae sp.]
MRRVARNSGHLMKNSSKKTLTKSEKNDRI